MLVNKEDYLKHWGVKGMSWDTKKSKAEGAELGLTPYSDKYQGSGYKDKNGKFYKGSIATAIKKKKDSDFVDLKNKYEKDKASHSMIGKVKNISNKTIAKGKSFIDNLFSRRTPISKVNASRRINNSTRP